MWSGGGKTAGGAVAAAVFGWVSCGGGCREEGGCNDGD